MASRVVAAPPLDADALLFVDWLELVAFFDRRRVARLDEIENALKIQSEEQSEDNGSEDAEKEDRRSLIEEEVARRSGDLGEAYPFVMSEDGEELRLKSRGERKGACFYLTCLIISHFTKSSILLEPPVDDAAAKIRKRQFQVLSTLAVGGHVNGPAVSFGWPRASGESITAAVQRCCDTSGTGSPRNPPGAEASKSAKDGGMDVIAWRAADNNRPPPAIMYFGQAASGHNWSGKSANDEMDQFLGGYFTDRPACNTAAVTVIPFRLEDEDHNRFGRRHGHILDRLRTPLAAMNGYRLASENGVAIDEAASVGILNSWLWRYRREKKAAA